MSSNAKIIGDVACGQARTRPASAAIDLDKDNLRSNFKIFHSEKRRSWGPLAVDVVSRDLGEAICRSTCHRLTFMLTDFAGTMADDDRPAWESRLMRGSFVYRPPDTTLRSTLSAGRYVQVLQSRESYDSLASEMVRGGVLRLEPRYALEDPLISQLVFAIVGEVAGGVLDQVLVDALNTTLAVRILRRVVGPSMIAPATANGLSSDRLRRVQDYIESHLADPLNLGQIADIACLSRYHFCRSFKRATGMTPHQYVVQRRVERAKILMRRTNRPLGMVAQDSGFADQSHLTSVFRREIGLTPGRFRAALAT
jgi:AraC-like DNA-binding protein